MYTISMILWFVPRVSNPKLSNPKISNPKMSNKGCNPFWYSFDGVVAINTIQWCELALFFDDHKQIKDQNDIREMYNKGCNPFWYSFDGVVAISSDYKDDENIRAFIQKTIALSFVPISFVRNAWNAIKANMPQDARLQNYSNYFESTWLDGYFRPQMWNNFSNPGPLTNNHLEGWQNRMKRIAQKAHPNIYEMLELLQKEQATTEVTISQLEAGGIVRARTVRWTI